MPGNTVNLLNSSAAATLTMPIVNNPFAVVAITLGIAAAMIADARPATVLLGPAGTATGILSIRMVSPAVNPGLAVVDVITPYTRD